MANTEEKQGKIAALPFCKGVLIKGVRVNAFSRHLFLEGSADARVWRKEGKQTVAAGAGSTLGPLLSNLYGVGR